MAEGIARSNGDSSALSHALDRQYSEEEMTQLGFQSPNPLSNTGTAPSPSHHQYYSLSRLMLSGISREKASLFPIDSDEVPAISNKTGCQRTSRAVLQGGRLPNKSILFGEGEANSGLGKEMVGLQLLLHACRQATQPAYLPMSCCIWQHTTRTKLLLFTC